MTKTQPTFRTAWSELNDLATGDIALQRGNTVLIEGLTHSYKSGMLLDLYLAICTLNVPEDTSSKPTVLLINGETSPSSWLTRIYDILKLEETGGQVPIAGTPVVEMIGYVNKKLQANGWNAAIITIPVAKWSAQDFCEHLDEYAASGHDLQVVLFDSMESLSYETFEDSDRLDALKTLQAYMASRNILFVATRQLPLAAMQARRSGVVGEDLLDEVFDMTRRNGGMIVDAELMVDVTRGDEKYDLLIGYGSHRHNVKPAYKRLPFYDGTMCIKK